MFPSSSRAGFLYDLAPSGFPFAFSSFLSFYVGEVDIAVACLSSSG